MQFGFQLLRTELAHGEEFEHAILHVAESEVILFQDLDGARQVELVVAARVPRQFGDRLEICANDLRFHTLATGALEAPQLAFHFLLRFLRQHQPGELFAQRFDFLARVVVTQLLLDRLQLLAQKHFALTIAEFFLHLILDLFLRREHADLALHMHEHAADALLDAERFQERLLLRHINIEIAGHEIGEATGLGHAVEHLMHRLFRQAALLTEFGGALACFAVQRFERGILRIDRFHVGRRHDHRGQEAIGLREVERGRSGFALKQKLDATETALDLADAGNHTGGVEHVAGGLVTVIALCDGKNQAVALERRLDGPKCSRATGGDRGGEAGENHLSAKGQDRQGLAFSHGTALSGTRDGLATTSRKRYGCDLRSSARQEPLPGFPVHDKAGRITCC